MAIQFRRGTQVQWDANNSNIVAGEPAVTTDTKKMYVGTADGEYFEIASKEALDSHFPVATSDIANGAVTGAKMADEAVSTDKIASGAVTHTKIAMGAVNPIKFDSTVYASTLPKMDGEAHKGELPALARADHRHPTDTSRASAQTALYFDSEGYLCFQSLAE